ncbi:uncharacterized protein [Diadema antillarum]|uniref:uncharacterized protein n=1 Tax=Diadema antillarum TaxID=105358 RepID=UPI003A8760AA
MASLTPLSNHLDSLSRIITSLVLLVLCHSELPKPNITGKERRALEELAGDKTSVIVPADKGRCVVVLDKDKYTDKCLDLLDDKKTYKSIGYNPTNGYRKTVTGVINKIHKEGGFSDRQKQFLTPPTEPTVPGFYGLPKVHKPDPIPVRPIVSCIGSVTYSLAKHVANILKTCKDGHLAFLDVEVHVDSDGTLSTSVYRKPTHKDQYLNFQSHHPLVHKLAVIRTLFHRADTIVHSPSEVEKEKANIKNALAGCGYPDWAFSKADTPKQPSKNTRRTHGVQGRKVTITIPYVHDLSDKIKRLFQKQDITTAFKPHNIGRD